MLELSYSRLESRLNQGWLAEDAVDEDGVVRPMLICVVAAPVRSGPDARHVRGACVCLKGLDPNFCCMICCHGVMEDQHR